MSDSRAYAIALVGLGAMAVIGFAPLTIPGTTLVFGAGLLGIALLNKKN